MPTGPMLLLALVLALVLTGVLLVVLAVLLSRIRRHRMASTTLRERDRRAADASGDAWSEAGRRAAFPEAPTHLEAGTLDEPDDLDDDEDGEPPRFD